MSNRKTVAVFVVGLIVGGLLVGSTLQAKYDQELRRPRIYIQNMVDECTKTMNYSVEDGGLVFEEICFDCHSILASDEVVWVKHRCIT